MKPLCGDIHSTDPAPYLVKHKKCSWASQAPQRLIKSNINLCVVSLGETFSVGFIHVTLRKMYITRIDRNSHNVMVNKNRYHYVKAPSGNTFGSVECDTFLTYRRLTLPLPAVEPRKANFLNMRSVSHSFSFF